MFHIYNRILKPFNSFLHIFAMVNNDSFEYIAIKKFKSQLTI